MPSLHVFVVSEQVEGDAVEDGEVLRGIAGAFAVQVFSEADIESPVGHVFDAPVLANGLIQPRRVGAKTGDVAADFAFGDACCPLATFRLDAHQPL